MQTKIFLFVLLLLLSTGLKKVNSKHAASDLQGQPGPVFRNGEAQIVPEFSDEKTWIREMLWVETNFDSDKDGKFDRMHVFVTRPAQTESGNVKLPVIYMSSPYYGLKLFALMGIGSKKNYWNVKHELGATPKSHKHTKLRTRDKKPILSTYYDRAWIPHGYIMVYSSSPGTGLSDGVPTIGGENESLAPKAVIDWLCGRVKAFKTRTGNEEVYANWSTGKVGMIGTSYDGTLCLAAATTGVEGLEAIIPVAPVSSFYHYYRSNGLVKSPDGYLGEDMDVLYDFINTGKKSNRKKNNNRIRDSLLVIHEDRITGDYNDFWASRDYTLKIDSMKAALLMSHGFNDWNVMPEQSYRFYKAAKEKGLPVQLYYHQDGHGGDPPFTMMNKWFTRYLHGIENGVEKDPPVRIVREFNASLESYSSFPDTAAKDITFYFKSTGANNGDLTIEKPESQKYDTLTDDYHIEGKEMWENKNAEHRLLFLSPILQKNLRISGTSRIKLRVSSSKPEANLSVWLISLPWKDEKRTQIYENVITRGWADPQNYKSIAKGELLKQGEFYEVSFDLMPDDQVIQKGQQIGIMIFSSDQEFTLWPKPGTKLIIDLNASTLTLPVVGGSDEYKRKINN